MNVVAFVVGVLLVVSALADLLNTLVTTSTSNWKWWPSNIVSFRAFGVLRFVTTRMPESSWLRERMSSVISRRCTGPTRLGNRN